MKIDELLSPHSIVMNFEAIDTEDALQQLVYRFRAVHPKVEGQSLLADLLKREKLGSTGIGSGIAIPHTRSRQVEKPTGLLAISKKGVDFDALDGQPVRILFLIVYPQNPVGIHLVVLSKVAKLLRDDFVKNSTRRASSPEQVMQVFRTEEDRKKPRSVSKVTDTK